MTDYSKSKFENAVADYLYSLSLDGRGEEVGEHGDLHVRIDFDEIVALRVNDLLVAPFDIPPGRTCWFDNGPGMPDIITGYWGAILHEDEQGFVTVTLCPTSMEYEEEWNRIEHIHSAYESMVGSNG